MATKRGLRVGVWEQEEGGDKRARTREHERGKKGGKKGTGSERGDGTNHLQYNFTCLDGRVPFSPQTFIKLPGPLKENRRTQTFTPAYK